MARVAALGITKFEDMVNDGAFYIDKTNFIKEWFDSLDRITLITRPRRFGKTLTLNMVETFFSIKYAGRSDLFESFDIWKDETLRAMQGQYPVINVSLANVKCDTYEKMAAQMKSVISALYRERSYLLESDKLDDDAKEKFAAYRGEKTTDQECMDSLLVLSEYMRLHYGKPVIILVDEYDTPAIEAYTAGYWDEAIVYTLRMFHAAFKDNPNLFRGLMTGITRITPESILSDLNNIAMVTTTTNAYETCFGFTEAEVYEALDEFGLSDQKNEVKRWYDGFKFGETANIYNPWSILSYLSEKDFKPYWMNTSSNTLVGKLVQEGSLDVKSDFETLLNGGTIVSEIDESITYAELTGEPAAIWSWLLTTGYLKIVAEQEMGYELALTNYEVRFAMRRLIKKWFNRTNGNYSAFMRTLLSGSLEEMQEYMERVLEVTFSSFDTGNGTKENRMAEQFYHGFTLGLIADLSNTHTVTSNRESGYGRYDVCIEPHDVSAGSRTSEDFAPQNGAAYVPDRRSGQDGIIIEFKVFDPKKEKTIEETAKRALQQIENRKYETALRAKGIKNIRKYGFAFKGREVLIEESAVPDTERL